MLNSIQRLPAVYRCALRQLGSDNALLQLDSQCSYDDGTVTQLDSYRSTCHSLNNPIGESGNSSNSNRRSAFLRSNICETITAGGPSHPRKSDSSHLTILFSKPYSIRPLIKLGIRSCHEMARCHYLLLPTTRCNLLRIILPPDSD